MKLFKKYIIDSQIFVSLVGTLFSAFFMLSEGNFSVLVLSLVFFTYFIGYSYTRIQGQNSLLFGKKIVPILLSIFCLLSILCYLDWDYSFRWLSIIILGLLYNSFFLKFSIRNIPFIKIFYVGFIWALITSWLIIPKFNVAIFFISLTFISALILPFDIRDKDTDIIKTFPKKIGVSKSKILASVMLIISGFVANSYLDNAFSISYLISIFISILFILFSSSSRNNFYYSFWVESCCALPLFTYIVLWLINC